MAKFNPVAQGAQSSKPVLERSVRDNILKSLGTDSTIVKDEVAISAPQDEVVGGVSVPITSPTAAGAPPPAVEAPMTYEDEGAYDQNMGLNPDGSVMPLGKRAALAMKGKLNPSISTNRRGGGLQPTVQGSGKIAEEAITLPTYRSRPGDDALTGMINRANNLSKGLQELTYGGNWHFAGPDAETISGFRKTGEKTQEVKDIMKKRREMNTLAETVTTKIPNAVITDDLTGRYAMTEEFGRLISVVAENHIPESFLAVPDKISGQVSSIDFDDDTMIDDSDYGPEERPDGWNEANKEINPIEGASRLGRDIIKWQNVANEQNGIPPVKLSEREYKDLGAFAIQAYQLANPDLIMTVVDPVTGGTRYQLTSLGKSEFGSSDAVRKDMFGVKIPPIHRRPEDGKLNGSLSQFYPQFRKMFAMGDVKAIEESMANQSKVNHVVSGRRLKLLLVSIIPTMFRQPGAKDDHFGKIFSVGETNLRQTYVKALRMDGLPEVEANKEAKKVVNSNKKNLLKQGTALVMNFGRANYQTFAAQKFTGRTHAQQTDFNLTRNKMVRFATRGQKPTKITKGSKTDINFLNTLALNLLNDKQDGEGVNDLLTWNRRAQAAFERLPKWYKMGKAVKQLLDEALPDANFDELVSLLQEGVKLDDPRIPKHISAGIRKFGDGLPEDVRQLMNDKKEDGMMALDNLLEVVDYMDNMASKGEHYSYNNAFIDGKTNGIAIAAAILGNMDLAYRTGVIRANDATHVLMDESGNSWDVRDAMKHYIQNKVKQPTYTALDMGFKELSEEGFKNMIIILNHMGGYKLLNKNISMVFPYGKELGGMIQEVSNHFMDVLGDVENEEFAAAVEALESSGVKTGQILHAIHMNVIDALFEVFGRDTFEGRSLMRNSASLMAAMDYNLRIEGANGMNINLGGDKFDADSAEMSTIQAWDKNTGQKSILKSQVTKQYESAAAERNGQIGGASARRSVVIPVHSIDAAIMNRLFSDKVIERLRKLYPDESDLYLAQIYDALKVDVTNIEDVTKAVNDVFEEIVSEYDYFDRTYQAVTNARAEFEKEVSRDPMARVKVSTKGRFSFISDMIIPTPRVFDDGSVVWTHMGLLTYASSTMTPNRGETPKKYKARVKHRSIELGEILKNRIPALRNMGEIHRDAGEIPDTLTMADIGKIVEILFEFGKEKDTNYSKTSTQFLTRIQKQRRELFNKLRKQKQDTGLGSAQYWAH